MVLNARMRRCSPGGFSAKNASTEIDDFREPPPPTDTVGVMGLDIKLIRVNGETEKGERHTLILLHVQMRRKSSWNASGGHVE